MSRCEGYGSRDREGVLVSSLEFQSGKTYCAAFCASAVALLAGSGYNASCNGFQWLETVVDCNKVREDVALLIYLYWASMKLFWHFTVKKTSLPLLAERLSS